MILNTKKRNGDYLVVVCDGRELLGKRLSFVSNAGERAYYVKPQYYNGEEKSREEIKEQIKKATILDLLGEESVNLGKEAGKIKDVLTMFDNEKEIPYALWFSAVKKKSL